MVWRPLVCLFQKIEASSSVVAGAIFADPRINRKEIITVGLIVLFRLGVNCRLARYFPTRVAKQNKHRSKPLPNCRFGPAEHRIETLKIKGSQQAKLTVEINREN